MQRCGVRGYHRLGREQGNTANNRDGDYVSMWVSFHPPNVPWGCIFAGRLLSISLARHTLADGAPRVYVYIGWHDPYSSLSSPLESISHSESSYKKPNTSRYSQGVRFADGVSLTQEEHFPTGICFIVFLSFMRFSCCVLLYVTKLEGGAGKRTPWG